MQIGIELGKPFAFGCVGDHLDSTYYSGPAGNRCPSRSDSDSWSG